MKATSINSSLTLLSRINQAFEDYNYDCCGEPSGKAPKFTSIRKAKKWLRRKAGVPRHTHRFCLSWHGGEDGIMFDQATTFNRAVKQVREMQAQGATLDDGVLTWPHRAKLRVFHPHQLFSHF